MCFFCLLHYNETKTLTEHQEYFDICHINSHSKQLKPYLLFLVFKLDSKKCDHFVLKRTALTLAIINSYCVHEESVFYTEKRSDHQYASCPTDSPFQPLTDAVGNALATCWVWTPYSFTAALWDWTRFNQCCTSCWTFFQLPTPALDNSVPKSSDLPTKKTVLDMKIVLIG